MTRFRNRSKKEKDDESGSTRPNASAMPPSDNFTAPPTAPTTPKPDFVGAVLSENWKQQSLVKKNSNHSLLTTMMLLMQIAAASGLIVFATSMGGAYVVPAIGAAGYTVATVNNSFDKSLHGLLGFLDSPVSIRRSQVFGI